MKESQQSQSSSFLKTDRGKTKSNAIEVPSISLPKGGGAIKGIDEKFSVNAVNGTASFSIPLPVSPARGATPSLSVSYNSGSGNGIFGLGWSLNLSSIKRKTDKGLPQYFDQIESDSFLFSEAEDLVPEFKKNADGSFPVDTNGDYVFFERDTADGFRVRYYKPRIEGLFARIERWTNITTGRIKWRVMSRENQTTLFGWTDNSVIADPGDPLKIFEWLPEFVFDDKGNCCYYLYKKEDNSGLDPLLVHNRNRIFNGNIHYTNLYLEKIFYGNQTPYKLFNDPYPVATDYLFSIQFDYGTSNQNDAPDFIPSWDFRADAYSEYKPGFEIRTTRLCKRVLLFHHFRGDNEYDGLVKAIVFGYDTGSQQGFTFLKSIINYGYIKKGDGSYSSKKLPAIEFEYQSHDWNNEVKTFSPDNLVHSPAGLDEQQYQFTDLFNEGLSGILTEQANGWYYKHNLGEGKFEQAKLVSPKPSFTGLGRQLQLADLDADGGKQLVSYSAEPKGYFELSDNNEWLPLKSFQNLPNIDFGDTNTRMVDLDGDGMPEILITEENVFTWYKAEGRNGFSVGNKSVKLFDEEAGPSILFADSAQSIFLADMSGDGMTDIVRIRSGEVCYWPNLGYGKFGARIAMDNAPVFDHPESFNPGFIKLADIDGSGTTDVIYLGKNKFSCWLNYSGNSFSTTPYEIDAFPDIHSQSKINVTDLLGNGVACIVWSSGLSKDGQSALRYIDLMNSRKPHIMVSYKNNLGKEVSFEYTPSTKFYIEDKLAGKPWVTKLHFPVHCISKTETVDKISGWRFVSSYKYHHGYYDHPEREFRGFGMVEQIDAEHFEHWAKANATNITDASLHQEPVVMKSWFHTGAFLRNEKILDQFAREYWYQEMDRQGFQVTHPEIPLTEARIIPAKGIPNSYIDHLSVTERREALRACKSMPLRSEVFAHDAPQAGASPAEIEKQLTPYSVSTHNCVIELLQPKGKNRHAVFVVKESEAITYSYERNTTDPRIAHNLNIKLDEYGNVLESAAIVYSRDPAILAGADFAPPGFPAETKAAQQKTTIIYSHNQFTNDSIDNDTYRLRLPSEAKTFELQSVPKSTGNRYTIADFQTILADAIEIPYEDLSPAGGNPRKRMIEQVRTNYYANDLVQTLPLHKLESLAFPYESYQLAYTPGLLTNIFSVKVDDATLANLMIAGNFAHSIDGNGQADGNWWIRSGTVKYLENDTATDARNRFFVPKSYTDPYGSITKVQFDSSYNLFIKETEDALQNKSGVNVFSYRTLLPQQMRDMNNNLSEVIMDELGLVKAMAVMGKGNEADDLNGLFEYRTAVDDSSVSSFFGISKVFVYDPADTVAKNLLQQATTRFVYDFDVYQHSGKPAVVASIVRETHYRKDENNFNPESKLQLSFEYSNGLGKIVMKKMQAEPGPAKQVTIGTGNSITVVETDTGPNLRWIGNGRTILNNKGNPIKQYEPYFSVTHHYEDFKELVEAGVTPIMYYDALGRMVKTEMPDGAFSKQEFDSWKQIVYDANDTVEDSEWYNDRIGLSATDPERTAAIKAAAHYNTPSQLHFDSLGRPVLQIENNSTNTSRDNQLYKTLIDLDVEGNLRSVIDARANLVMEYKYDMLGNLVYQKSMDSGKRWLLHNVLGNPLRTWDERDHEIQYSYDVLHRPLQSVVINTVGNTGDSILNNIFERNVYGEAETDPESKNLRGQILRHYDTGGLLETPEYDFKGQPKSSSRKLFVNYKDVVNWVTDNNQQTDLESQAFIFTTETDALGRISKQTAPDGSVIKPSYNAAGLLDAEIVTHFNPAVTTTYLKDINYNEKGQRSKIIYGNDVMTKFFYDEKTFRLKQLRTQKQNGDFLQDIYYTYDPSGNITRIEDQANDVSFFNNMRVEPVSEYTYDGLYRLIEAKGRENNTALSFAKENWNDEAKMMSHQPIIDPMAVVGYTEKYEYDEVGSILKMDHVNGWTRTYEYATASNRLEKTTVGGNTFLYPHHAQHGFITQLPHLTGMGWNSKEELILTTKQNVTSGTPETTYYQYDGQGQRIRKITENYATGSNQPTKKEERIYISGYELFKKHDGSGLERTSLSVLDQGHRFVMVETRNNIDDGTEQKLVRYQLHNHLGSVSLELNETGEVISYEEYHPFGTTAYQAINNTIRSAAKRYRYTGMERDEETGLEYHSARYYLPWLGRWLSADPIGLGDGTNIYQYSGNNPILLIDTNGKQTEVPVDSFPANPVNGQKFIPYADKGGTWEFTYNSEAKDWIAAGSSLKEVEVFGEKEDGFWSKVLDGVQIGLDIVGMIPVFGEIADGINGLISLGRGDYLGASLSFAAMIPIAGWAATAGKLTKKALKYSDEVSTLVSSSDEISSISSSVSIWVGNSRKAGFVAEPLLKPKSSNLMASKTFKSVDSFQGDLLISKGGDKLKDDLFSASRIDQYTIRNLSKKTYTNPGSNALFSSVKKKISSLGEFESAKGLGQTLIANSNTKRVFKIGIPQGDISAHHFEQIIKIKDWAKEEYGVRVLIKALP